MSPALTRCSASIEEVPDEDTLLVKSVNVVSDFEEYEIEPESGEDKLSECDVLVVTPLLRDLRQRVGGSTEQDGHRLSQCFGSPEPPGTARAMTSGS